MKLELQNLIKEEIGYTDKVKQCSQCKYYIEVDNQYVDRMWDSLCTYSNLGNIGVTETSYCDKFEKK